MTEKQFPDQIILAQGNGGRFMRELIEDVFFQSFGNEDATQANDAAFIETGSEGIFTTTDGFTVQPLEFPGGDLGSLAVHGTVNDLAVAGALPRWLTLSVILEEGLSFHTLKRMVQSFAEAAKKSGVSVVAGDTKVVPRGSGGGAYFSVSGIGTPARKGLGFSQIKAGDKILISGTIGDHGTAVMLAREEFGLKSEILSDSTSVINLCKLLWPLEGLRFLRDPTRGGLATVAHEICSATSLGVRLDETSIPVQNAVTSVCEILGYDPFYLACEGRLVAVVSPTEADTALSRLQECTDGQRAAIIGTITPDTQHVVLETEIGGERILEELEDDPLPRIC